MKTFIIPAALVAFGGSAVYGLYQNATIANAESAARSQEMAAELKSETQQQYRARMQVLVAKEFRQSNLTTIVGFKPNGEIYIVPPTQKQIPATSHTFKIGMPMPDFEGNRSNGIYDPVAKLFAVVAKENGTMKIKAIFTLKEIEHTDINGGNTR
jgi:hypothetical protein